MTQHNSMLLSQYVIATLLVAGAPTLSQAQSSPEVEAFCMQLAADLNKQDFESFHEAFDVNRIERRMQSQFPENASAKFKQGVAGIMQDLRSQIEEETFLTQFIQGSMVEFLGLRNVGDDQAEALFRFVPQGGLGYIWFRLEQTILGDWQIADLFGMQHGMWLSQIYATQLHQMMPEGEQDAIPRWLVLMNTAMAQHRRGDYGDFFRTYAEIEKEGTIPRELRMLYVNTLAAKDPERFREVFSNASSSGPDPTAMTRFAQSLGQRDFDQAQFWLKSLKAEVFEDPYLAYFDLQLALFEESFLDAVAAGEILMKKVPAFQSDHLVRILALACCKTTKHGKLIEFLEFYRGKNAAPWIIQQTDWTEDFDGFFRDPVAQKCLKGKGIPADVVQMLGEE